MKLTPWYPPEIRPVRVGEYRTCSLWTGKVALRWFDGKLWSCAYLPDEPIVIRLGERQKISQYQDVMWRGLAKEPK
jgi:hypothetical protein